MMNQTPEPVKTFNDELASMLTQKPPVSSNKMRDITRGAMKAQKFYKHIVLSVEKLIQKCKPEYKLSGVYVIDAIVRQSKHQNKERDNYAARFEINLQATSQHLFKCSRGDQVKICRTFKLWELNSVFSYHTMQKCLNNAPADVRKEGVALAEESISKMRTLSKSDDLAKQKQELDEQRRLLAEQQEEIKRKQEELLNSSIPANIGNILFGVGKKEESQKNTPTDHKAENLMDDFNYGDEVEIKQQQLQAASHPKKEAPPTPTSKKKEEKSAPPSAEKYNPNKSSDARELDKLYTPSPIEKPAKKSKHRSRSPDSKDRRRKSSSRDSSRDKRHKKSRRESKRSRSSSPIHHKKERESSRENTSEKLTRPNCVTILTTTIWIGNIRKTVPEGEIVGLLKKTVEKDSIKEVNMVPPRGCCYVLLADRSTAEKALTELKDLKLHGTACKVAWAPGKGCKGKDLRKFWNTELGATFIPFKNYTSSAGYSEGGIVLESSLPGNRGEGAGEVLEQLFHSIKDGPPGNGLASEEDKVSAKLDQLHTAALKGRSRNLDSSRPVPDSDSIVHLLNSPGYRLPEPVHEEEYFTDRVMSPPETIGPTDQGTPLKEEPLPYSRPVEAPYTRPVESSTPSPIKAERRSINLQTYLRRKNETPEDTPGETPGETPEETPYETPDQEVPAAEAAPQSPQAPPSPVVQTAPSPAKTPLTEEVGDDLLQWASQDTNPGTGPEGEKLVELESPVLKRDGPMLSGVSVEEGEKEAPMETTPETFQKIREPSISPEKALASIRSPSISPEKTPPQPTALKSPDPPILDEEGEIRDEEEEERKEGKSRSRSKGEKPKKKKKSKKSKKSKKKKAASEEDDSDIDEDIRKLELLKAELEREERKEREREARKEKEKRKERKRSASPKYKEKHKKDKRAKR